MPINRRSLKVVDPMDKAIFTTSTGVNLRLKKVNSFLIVSASNNIEYPDPPEYTREGRTEPEQNFQDPDYKAAVARADGKKIDIITNIFLGYGCESIPPYPSGIESPESTTWSTELREMTGIEVPSTSNARLRKAAWIKFHVLNDMVEVNKLIDEIQKFSGNVSEQEVEQAQESFRP